MHDYCHGETGSDGNQRGFILVILQYYDCDNKTVLHYDTRHLFLLTPFPQNKYQLVLDD